MKKITIFLTAAVIAVLMAVTFNNDVQIGASLMSTIYFLARDSGLPGKCFPGNLLES
jgi:hypothetical protein